MRPISIIGFTLSLKFRFFNQPQCGADTATISRTAPSPERWLLYLQPSMNGNILIFNFIFYFITLLFYYQGKQDPSSSLGYGLFIIVFWGVSIVTLIILLTKKIIQPKTTLDKLGVVTATPVLCILAVALISTFNETPTSEWHFNKDHHRYKVMTFDHRATGKRKRIEYYKSEDTVSAENPFPETEKWLKDSTWIYFSESGDTTKTVIYRDDIKVE